MSDQGRALLDLELPRNHADAATVRDYLKALLQLVWINNFNSDRPFGHPHWDDEIYVPMINAGLVDGEVDGFGHVFELDYRAADNLITEAIESLQ